jgi:hypothetical protein
MCAFASPFAVSAQATAKVAPQSKRDFPSFLFVPQVHVGAPLEAAAGAALLVPTKPWHCEDGICGGPGIEVQAMAGSGGWRVAGGATALGFPFWTDALVTLTRTGTTPRRASPESTYLGAEGGVAFPVSVIGQSFVTVRPSVGFARRLDGVGPESERTTFTWNVGVCLMMPKF